MESLLNLLEHEVLPAFADRERWLAMMQASITMGEQMFSSDRMVQDYFQRLYGPE